VRYDHTIRHYTQTLHLTRRQTEDPIQRLWMSSGAHDRYSGALEERTGEQKQWNADDCANDGSGEGPADEHQCGSTTEE
jgi:hypothetical protein